MYQNLRRHSLVLTLELAPIVEWLVQKVNTKGSPRHHVPIEARYRLQQKRQKKEKMPSQHGGKRDNAGKKKWNHPSKRQSNQPVLGSFFQGQNNPTSSTSSTSSSRPRTTNVSSPPSQTTTQRQNNPTSSTSSTSLTRSRTTNVSSPPSQTTTQSSSEQSGRQFVYGNQPNNNVADDDDYKRGKRISGSVNLMSQKKVLMEDSYLKKATENIRLHGQFWDLPPTYVVKNVRDLKTCWMDFFKLPVFNWIPQAALGDNWKPHCPNCKKKMTKNGVKLEPRLVFGQHQNYWLNSRQRWKCECCRGLNAEAKKKGEPSITWNYSDTSEEVLKELEDTHPELMNVFPCHITNVNAIDKKLMDLVVHCAVKGVGPAAISEIITSFHELEWQKHENEWLATVHRLLNQPSVTQQSINRDEIEKCPSYFSLELGGCVPSGTWLIEMFCILIRRMRKYLDSECIKRAKSSKILSMDASYKIIKWMMLWGKNERVYNALISGGNEYNEIPLQFFSTSDNHEEIGENLKMLAKAGMNPYIAFTDDPDRDESIFKKHFSNLANACDEDEEEIPDNLTELKSEKQIMYLHEISNTTMMLSKFREDLENAIKDTSGTVVRLSFDTEWPLYRDRDPHASTQTRGNTNIVALGSNVVDYTIILELYNFVDNDTSLNRIGQKLKAIFCMNVDVITGCNHLRDYNALQKEYPSFQLPDEPKKLMEDVSLMSVNRGLTVRGRGNNTLQALCMSQKMYIKKPANVRVGTVWDSKGTLSNEALKYSQMDVEAPLVLHSLYSGIPDMTLRASALNLRVGTVVDIMPAQASAVQPIAQGVIKQLGGRGSVWQSNKRKINSNQVLVQVKKVFDPKGIIHYPSSDTNLRCCSCGRATHQKIGDKCDFYLYSQFGKPNFHVVELKSRLRLHNELYKYPPCIYETQQDGTVPECELVNLDVGAADESIDPKKTDGDSNNDQALDDNSTGDDHDHDIPEEEVEGLLFDPEVLDAMKDDDGDVTDGSDSLDYDEGDPTPTEMKIATCAELNKELEKILEDADSLAISESIFEPDEEKDLPIEDIAQSRKRFKTVLGDCFHFMDRAKLPMHHEYKALFFRALRAAMFIMCKQDVDEVMRVLKSKGISWDKAMAFNFSYISARVRRIVPPPTILYNRLVAVFNFFKDRKDTASGVTLFNDNNRNKYMNMLASIKKGYASDPKGISMYVPKTETASLRLFVTSTTGG